MFCLNQDEDVQILLQIMQVVSRNLKGNLSCSHLYETACDYCINF